MSRRSPVPPRPGRPVRRRLTGWGRATGSTADVLPVADGCRVVEVLARCGPRGALARGLGRSYGDAAQNAGGVVLDATGLDTTGLDTTGIAEPLSVRDGILTVGAGMSVRRVHREIVPQGWMLPVVPGTESVTMGGALAADVHGKNHRRDGSFARHVESFTLATGGGMRRIDPVGQPDEFWATAGGMGLTGVVTELTVRLRPIETPMMVVHTRRQPDSAAVLADLADGDPHYTAAWIDTTGRRAGRGVVSTAEHAGLDDLPHRRARPASGRRMAPTVPPIGVSVIGSASVRLASALRYRASRPGRRIEPYHSYQFPLDALGEWHRLYGRAGLVQHQMAVPSGREYVIEDAVAEIRRRRIVCALAVLKRLGPGDPGPLSFPIEGWTLALDLPRAQAGLTRLLSDLDDAVVAAGGRVYLAKDACTTPSSIRAMYPELPAWRRVRDRMDPGGVMQSDLARRLDLTGRGGR